MARKVLGQKKTSMALDYGTNAKHSKLGDKCEPDGIPYLWLPLNGNRDPGLLSGHGNYHCGGEWQTDPASDQKIKPCNLSTTTPLVINRDMDPVDLAKKANPYLCNEEHKQEQERMQPNCRWMIISRSWCLTNRWTAKLFLIEWSKQNTNPNGGAAAVYEDSRVVQNPWTRP